MNISNNDDPIKILTVINSKSDSPNKSKSDSPNKYAAKCTGDLENDVRKAFKELSLAVSNDVVDDIVKSLHHWHCYWHHDYCFDFIVV